MNATAAVRPATTRAETHEQREQRRREARDQWHARAVELAFDRQLIGTARLVNEDTEHGTRMYHVPSADRRGEGHLVSIKGERIVCSCPAGLYGAACSHSGAAIHYERQRAAAERGSEGNVAWDWWMDGGQW